MDFIIVHNELIEGYNFFLIEVSNLFTSITCDNVIYFFMLKNEFLNFILI